jgi:hypothetical protein
MSKSDAFETALLGMIFQNANIANIGDATGLRGAAAAGQLFFALHTADPGEAGTQTTNEVTYTGYARVGVARSAAGFALTGNSISPVANVDFGAPTAGTGTATHFSIGTLASGAGMILYRGPLTPTIAFAPASAAPRILPATTITED